MQYTRYQDFTKELPVELLEHIFDLLDFASRLAARVTCRRWEEILSSDHYLSRTRMILSASTLLTTDMELLRRMKIHLNFVLRDNPESDVFLIMVREFLCLPDVADRVEELKLQMSRHSLLDLFAIPPVLMPNLKRLVVVPAGDMRFPDTDGSEFNLHAPNLKHVEFHESALTLLPAVTLFAHQVESMLLRDIDLSIAFDMIRDLDFPCLSSLTLIQEEILDWRPHGFSLLMTTALGRLKHLKCVSYGNCFTNAFRVLLAATTALESLHIDGSDITAAGLACMANMPRLRELYFLGRMIGNDAPFMALNSLERLTITQQLFCLNQAPRLTWVRVIYDKKQTGHLIWPTNMTEVFLRRACSKVRTLILEDVDVVEEVGEIIRSMTQIESLVLRRVSLTYNGKHQFDAILDDRVQMDHCAVIDEAFMFNSPNEVPYLLLDDGIEIMQPPMK